MATLHLDILVGEPPEQPILEILKHVRPTWNTEKLIIKPILGGNINRLYYCGLANDTGESDVVVVKVYGAGSEGVLDRDREVATIMVAQSVGLAAPLYCRFKNGLAYKYCPGNTITSEKLTDDSLARNIARKLATLHLVDYVKVFPCSEYNLDSFKIPYTMTLIEMAKKLLPRIKDDNLRMNNKPMNTDIPRKDQALEEMEAFGKEIQTMAFPACFCHSDANPSNTIYNTETGEIQLIDWETGGVDYAAHEIGWYFVGRTVNGLTEEGLAFYPCKEYQLKWIRWYLEYTAEMTGRDPGEVTEAEICKLYRGSIICVLMRLRVVGLYFAAEGQLSPANKKSFENARFVQRMFWIIKNGHYITDSSSF